MSHRSPCSEPVVDYMCVTHEKKSIRPKCLFPTVKASVRAVLVSGAGMVYIHSVPQQAGKCQNLQRLSGRTHFLCCAVSVLMTEEYYEPTKPQGITGP